MSLVFYPWHLLLVILAGWVNQQQQQIIEFQRTEIDVLKEKLGEEKDPAQRRSASPVSREGESSGPEGVGRNWRSLHAGHNPALAQKSGRSEVGL